MSTFKISRQFNTERLLIDTSVNHKITFLNMYKIIIQLDFIEQQATAIRM